MAVIVDPELLDHIAAHSGSCTFLLQDVPPEDAVRGLRAAARAVATIPHPEEPEDPLPSYVSSVEVTAGGAGFTIDIADAEAYDGLLERVLDAVLEGLGGAGVDSGVLTYPSGPPAGPSPAPHAPPVGHLPSPAMATPGWSALGLPLPEPHQPMWTSGSTEEHSAGYMVPHDMAAVLAHFESLPGVILSYLSAPPDDMVTASVVILLPGQLFAVLVRDATRARNIELTLVTDPGRTDQELAQVRSFVAPPDVAIRIDRRSEPGPPDRPM